MSTGYYVSAPIPITDLVGGRLDKYGIQDAKSADADDRHKCITDGDNYLWAYGDPVTSFARYRPNGRPGFILQAIANEFEVEVFFEDSDEPGYVPLGTPTEDQIAEWRVEWRAECAELDRELESLGLTWREKEIEPAS